jgi:hypothetical protein
MQQQMLNAAHAMLRVKPWKAFVEQPWGKMSVKGDFSLTWIFFVCQGFQSRECLATR